MKELECILNSPSQSAINRGGLPHILDHIAIISIHHSQASNIKQEGKLHGIEASKAPQEFLA